MSTVVATQPVPKETPVSEPYWAGLREGVLKMQKCRACGQLRHYPRLVCSRCWSMEVDWVVASGKAWAHSWSVAHHAFHPGLAGEVPYVVVVADLEEGVRTLGRLLDADAGSLQIGTSLQLDIRDRGDGLRLPFFRVMTDA